MKKEWKWNPKVKGSGIIECIPQEGTCPQKCPDCFFQSGRSYLEPLKENLPHIPSKNMARGRIVRINDGNDSNVQRELVEKTASMFIDKFFNTSIPYNIDKFPAPVVLTVNPSLLTDNEFHKVNYSDNLMFVRIRTNTWNINNIVRPAINYYTNMSIPVVLTFMAYYNEDIHKDHIQNYTWKKRTINSYWCITSSALKSITDEFENNSLVYSCGYKGQSLCKYCGNCMREYYNTKERMRLDKNSI